MKPRVSFVIPCYKLGHFLAECVNSIIAQSFADFEILIMDDCSPDETPKVASLLADARVRYFRNQNNIGPLRNYNKGIRLSSGEFVWLISADDRLRKPYILERYVGVMDDYPRVGYVFCPAVRLENGAEGEVIPYSSCGSRNRIFSGHEFLTELLVNGSTVTTPSAMVRRACYDNVSLFPEDLPWGGDWYLWCMFALHYDVGYIADPMVNYRRHALSMTDALVKTELRRCVESDIIVPFRVMKEVEKRGSVALVRACRRAIASQYAQSLGGRKYRSSSSWHEYSITPEMFEESLTSVARTHEEAAFIRAYAYSGAADLCYWQGNFRQALQFYDRATQTGLFLPKVLAKALLLKWGSRGERLRSNLLALRRMTSGTK